MAAHVGLTFQQNQKYEHGTNRISASTLYEMARALSTPVAEFFAGLPTTGRQSSRQSRALARFLATKEGLAVAALDALFRVPIHLPQENGRVQIQRLGNAEDDNGTRAALGAFQEADIVAVEARQRGEIFLTDAFRLAMAADLEAESLQNFLFAIPHA